MVSLIVAFLNAFNKFHYFSYVRNPRDPWLSRCITEYIVLILYLKCAWIIFNCAVCTYKGIVNSHARKRIYERKNGRKID